MIQKRYQRFGPNGIIWTKWYNYNPDDSRYDKVSKNIWELKPLFKSEYRIIKPKKFYLV